MSTRQILEENIRKSEISLEDQQDLLNELDAIVAFIEDDPGAKFSVVGDLQSLFSGQRSYSPRTDDHVVLILRGKPTAEDSRKRVAAKYTGSAFEGDGFRYPQWGMRLGREILFIGHDPYEEGLALFTPVE